LILTLEIEPSVFIRKSVRRTTNQEAQDMDSPATTTPLSASAFRTPPRLIIPKLALSRDRWKAKAAVRKAQYRKEKIHSRDLEISRQRWKDRALVAEQKLQELQQQLQHAEADLAETRSPIVQLQDGAEKN
jgi:phosphopantetheinyl transferase (holo-ACP synthase)